MGPQATEYRRCADRRMPLISHVGAEQSRCYRLLALDADKIGRNPDIRHCHLAPPNRNLAMLTKNSDKDP